MHICTPSMIVLLQKGTVIFLNAVIRPILGVEFKNPGKDVNEARTRTVSTVQGALLCPLTMVFNLGSDPSNEYSITIATACQRKIIPDSSLRSHHLLRIYYVTGIVHSDIWDNIIIILYPLVMGFYLQRYGRSAAILITYPIC